MFKKIFSLLLAAAVLAGLVWAGGWFFLEHYMILEGRILWKHSRDVILEGHDLSDLAFLYEFTRLEEIDARGSGLTLEQYQQLRREFPNCQIDWDVPFQGSYHYYKTPKLTVRTLTDADVEQMDYFVNLMTVDGWDCEDYDQLLALQQRHPGCKVFYDVEISGQSWDCDRTELELRDADVTQLREKLRYLPNVHIIHLSGQLPEMADLQKLQTQYPKVAFSWQVDVGEAVLELGASVLDLSGFPQADADAIRRMIPYLPGLERVDLTGCGLPMEELLALAREHPRIQFLFDVAVGPVTVSSDAEEIDLSGHAIQDPAVVENVLPAFRNLKKVIMVGCGLDSETMDALNQRHPGIRFVWSVNLGGLEVRTDATYFIPTKYDVDVSDRDLTELRYCVDMVCVDVGHMHGVRNCEWAAYMPNLKYLILADTGVWDISPLAGLENLVFLELFLTGVRDYSPLLECPALEDLNLCYTHGDPEPVTRITWLKRLWWAGNWNAKVRFADAFAENLPNCKFNFDTESSTGEGWRTGRNYYDMRDLLGMSYMTW